MIDLAGVHAQGVINRGRVIFDGYRTIDDFGGVLVRRAEHHAGLYTATADCQTECPAPVVSPRATGVRVEPRSSAEFARGNDQRVFEHASTVKILEQRRIAL